ncbi:hypothetical protein PoB_004938200 [Plakobranchus ocellatus]|uniref:Uncharacterized protein n=1 Tax=Plakobranchus ocellatus TaxID=259542 RepID=A0AAV4BV26_9GAST|nr:hypothetical protein PoB_004938200 [Plakobranchus ocellatus]
MQIHRASLHATFNRNPANVKNKPSGSALTSCQSGSSTDTYSSLVKDHVSHRHMKGNLASSQSLVLESDCNGGAEELVLVESHNLRRMRMM